MEKRDIPSKNEFSKGGPGEELHMWKTSRHSLRIRFNMPGVSSEAFSARVDGTCMIFEGSEDLMKSIISQIGEDIHRYYHATLDFGESSYYSLEYFKAELRNGVLVIDIKRSRIVEGSEVASASTSPAPPNFPSVKELVDERGRGANPLIWKGKDRYVLEHMAKDKSIIVFGIDMPGMVQGDQDIKVEKQGITFLANESERHPLEYEVDYPKRVYEGYVEVPSSFCINPYKVTSEIKNGILWIKVPRKLENKGDETHVPKPKPFRLVNDYSDHVLRVNDYSHPDIAVIDKELRELDARLPEGVFIRSYDDRPDLLRVGISGPKGSSHIYGIFVYDIQIPSNYPHCPPVVFDHIRNNLVIAENKTWNALGKCYLEEEGIMRVLRYIQACVLGGGNEIMRMDCWLYMLKILSHCPKHFQQIIDFHFNEKSIPILEEIDSFRLRKQLGEPPVTLRGKNMSLDQFKETLGASLEWIFLELYPGLQLAQSQHTIHTGFPLVQLLETTTYSNWCSASNPKEQVLFFEMRSLSIGLRNPIYQNRIFIKNWAERRDLFLALVVGRPQTPYAEGLYFFDIQLPSDYPDSPPTVVHRFKRFHISPMITRKDGVVNLPVLRSWSDGCSLMDVLDSIYNNLLTDSPLSYEPGFFPTPSLILNTVDYHDIITRKVWRLMVHVLRYPPEPFMRCPTAEENYDDYAVLLQNREKSGNDSEDSEGPAAENP